jgi:hypothetical protein
MSNESAVVTRIGLLDCQVCVPKDWTDQQIMDFVNTANPCGTQLGWQIRKEGSEHLQGAPERRTCADNPNRVHIMLDA